MANTKGNATPQKGGTASKTSRPASKKAAPLNDPSNEFARAQQLHEEAEAAAQVAERAADEAAAAADAAYAAREALVRKARPSSRTSSASPAKPSWEDALTDNSPEPDPEPASVNAPPTGGGADGYLGMMSGLLEGMGSDNWNADKFEDMSQGVSMVLGSGPAFAALGSMLANSTAQGSILMNATQMQRQLDQVGLCCTSACVQQLLNLNNDAE